MAETIPATFQLLDDRFRYVDGDFILERLHAEARKSEGPAYFPAGRYLVWSDIPNDRLLRWDETTGAVGISVIPPVRERQHRRPAGPARQL